jgi:C1A family cysteine protease
MPSHAGRGLGWKKDALIRPGMKADLSARPKLGLAPPPKSASARPYILDILDQGQLGSCTGNGSMQGIRASQVRQGAKAPPLGSRLWAYYMGRALSHDTANDDGAQIRNVFAGISRLGFPPESLWPYSDERTSSNAPFRTMPSTEAFNGAYDQRATGNVVSYFRLDDNDSTRVADVQRAIAAGYVVVFGTDVSENFCEGDLGSGPIAPPVGLPIAGGHCMCLAEYDTSASGIVTFGVVNSWGSSFGSGGWVEFSSDYVAWSATNDLWICEYAPLFAATS